MGGMSGFNMLYPYAWFASAGDPTGDLAHNHTYAPDGNFFNDQGQGSGAANPSGAAALSLPAATVAAYPLGAYAGYVNQSLENPGSQQPLAGGPTVLNGPQQGPWIASDYAAAIPQKYISAAPPWKNAPLQHNANSLPAPAQAAIHSTGSAPTVKPSGSCAGCGGGCGGGGRNSKSYCAGNIHQALQLDSTNDFPPLYSHPTANPNQVVNAALYHATSTHVPAWTVAQGAPADSEVPLQGH